MTAKMFAATQNINANKQNQLKITKETLILSISFAAVVCVYWYTGLSLACYSENIPVIYVVDETILPNLFVWQENDLVFSSEFEKLALQKTTILK